MITRRAQRGFTLVEVIVAFAIFALCVGALFESFSSATRRSRGAVEAEAAVLLAQSKLSELRVRSLPWPEEQSGTAEHGLTWRIAAKPLDMPVDEHNPWRPYEVVVHVRTRNGAGKQIDLRSIELAKVRS